MLENFENKAQRAIVEAESIAFDLGHSEVGSEHLLLALLKVKDSSFSKQLKKYHVDDEMAYQSVVKLFGKKDNMPFYMEYSKVLKKILEDAKKISEKQKEEKVSLNTLFIALLSQKESVGVKLLENHEVPIDKIKSQLNGEKSEECEKLKLEGCEGFTTVFNPSKKQIILGRDEEVKSIQIALSCREKANVALLGHAGVGKTAIVEELARILKYNPPKNLEGYQIISLDTNAAVAGTKFRGDFEEKIDKFLKGIKGKKVIIFIDEAHSLTKLGSAEGSTSLSEILKPILTKKQYKFIIATTEDEYQKFISENVAFARRFRTVHIKEPDKNKVHLMIKEKVADYKKFHQVNISQKQVKEVIDLSSEIPERFFPDKALDVIDYSMSCCAMHGLNEFDIKYAKQYIEGVN